MMKKIFLYTALVISVLSFSQKPVELRLILRDGNTMSGTSQMSDVILKTLYGTLNIPIESISSIQVGTGNDKLINEKANAYLKILNGSGSDDLKKAAYADLIKLGVKGIAAINEFQNDPKNSSEILPTGEYTIDNALMELKSTYNIDNTTPESDILTIDNQYTMGGAYEFQKIDIKTEYGNLSIPKEKIKSVDVTVISPTNGSEVVLKLMATKHISSNQNGGWLKTGISLKQGQKFTITASGEVTLASLSNQKYKPDGSYIATNGTSYPASTSTEEYGSNTYPVYGNVVYKIGEASTETLKAGAKYTGTANATGVLFISIYETVYNSANSGSYTVKISLK